ncbi:S-protein homolog 74-like [Cucurbita maxima]|uniref:S-protein homolog n=1 Tax=Cucurbita maxima TaxID=3661 RepID=A0A6J1KR58_CUCMA|nr:S-protein homolog 74-like [Cucurbita maxima]
MESVNPLCFILLLGLGSNMLMKPCFAQPTESKVQLPFSRWQVTIYNHMIDSTLMVHCKSKDNDLGRHEIKQGDNYFLKFKENIWQTTQFWCHFSSKYGQVTGDVFWPEEGSRLSDECNDHNCVWSAQDGGIFLLRGSINSYQLAYPWKK